MCRWMAYRGAPLQIEELLFKTDHSLIDQSLSSRSATPTNGDGFGLGWYGAREEPGLFRSIRPAWNDFNLRDLAAHIESPLFLAHVRAASQAAVQESNCHPFRYRNWLFVHNGELEGIERYRRELLLAVSPHLFSHIVGNTDSEVMFYLALTFGLADDPLGGIARMAGFVEGVARAHGVENAIWMTVGLSDGTDLYAVRYASDGDAPTLYHSRDMDDLHQLNPALKGRFSSSARAVVSEPLADVADAWISIPQKTAVVVRGDEVLSLPFEPADGP
jgi:predicted glutamine amidotransferase